MINEIVQAMHNLHNGIDLDEAHRIVDIFLADDLRSNKNVWFELVTNQDLVVKGYSWKFLDSYITKNRSNPIFIEAAKELVETGYFPEEDFQIQHIKAVCIANLMLIQCSDRRVLKIYEEFMRKQSAQNGIAFETLEISVWQSFFQQTLGQEPMSSMKLIRSTLAETVLTTILREVAAKLTNSERADLLPEYLTAYCGLLNSLTECMVFFKLENVYEMRTIFERFIDLRVTIPHIEVAFYEAYGRVFYLRPPNVREKFIRPQICKLMEAIMMRYKNYEGREDNLNIVDDAALQCVHAFSDFLANVYIVVEQTLYGVHIMHNKIAGILMDDLASKCFERRSCKLAKMLEKCFKLMKRLDCVKCDQASLNEHLGHITSFIERNLEILENSFDELVANVQFYASMLKVKRASLEFVMAKTPSLDALFQGITFFLSRIQRFPQSAAIIHPLLAMTHGIIERNLDTLKSSPYLNSFVIDLVSSIIPLTRYQQAHALDLRLILHCGKIRMRHDTSTAFSAWLMRYVSELFTFAE
ncbi:unnamed protein product [Caenorhabditis bovis]|nr:unnamed protein product [Caenorhabditis bovis]